MADLPRGTVTFLFTDVEESTRLAKELRESWPGVIADHQRLLRESFEAFSGHEIDTQGDAFFVAFQRATDAVAAAVAAQRAVSEHQWPDPGRVRVRMGLHTGEAHLADRVSTGSRHNGAVEPAEILERIEAYIRQHELIPSGGEVTCLVSGGADSTCLWHALRELGYRVSSLHVNHGLRGAESEEDARFCADVLGAEVIDASNTVLLGNIEAALRDARYSLTEGRGLRATGHTASDQVETILYRLVASGSTRGIKVLREDGVVRPLLTIWREETEAYCCDNGLEFRRDSSNPDTLRGLIRDELLPLLRRLHPAAEQNLLRLADERPRLPRAVEDTLLELLSTRDGSKSADLGRGVKAVREYDRLSLDQGPVRWGPWIISSDRQGLEVRARRSGDRLAGRRKKLQDVFVDAKVPRAERDAWPVVVRGEEVVAVPGIVEDAHVRATRPSGSSGVAGKGGEPSARRTVQRGTDKRRGRSILPPAASGGGGGRLRRPGAGAGEEREG